MENRFPFEISEAWAGAPWSWQKTAKGYEGREPAELMTRRVFGIIFFAVFFIGMALVLFFAGRVLVNGPESAKDWGLSIAGVLVSLFFLTLTGMGIYGSFTKPLDRQAMVHFVPQGAMWKFGAEQGRISKSPYSHINLFLKVTYDDNNRKKKRYTLTAEGAAEPLDLSWSYEEDEITKLGNMISEVWRMPLKKTSNESSRFLATGQVDAFGMRVNVGEKLQKTVENLAKK